MTRWFLKTRFEDNVFLANHTIANKKGGDLEEWLGEYKGKISSFMACNTCVVLNAKNYSYFTNQK
jgi:hypothetical protein